MKFIRLTVTLAAVLTGFGSPLLADYITNDTYIDNYGGSSAGDVAHYDVNYGGSGAIKAVTSPGSTLYPFATSAVRTLITLPSSLPSSFWDAAAAGNISTAIITLRAISIDGMGNTSPAGTGTIPAFSRTIAAYPLLHGFTAGTGHTDKSPGVPNTQGGTQNTSAAPVGADWNTYDGVHAWSSPGGTFDASDSVNGAFVTVNGNTYMQWDIAKLLNNLAVSQDTRSAIQNFGLLLRITDDYNFPTIAQGQQFVSFYSYENANTANILASSAPAFAFTLVPEPGSLAMMSAAALLLFRRRSIPQ